MILQNQVFDFIASIEPAWVQAISTVVLALVTLYYSKLIKGQIENERRREHSNTLRESVSNWLEDRFPVRDDELHSSMIAHDFHIVPEGMDSDPYIDDFRNNHAPEIDTKIKKINELIEDFEDSHREYRDGTPDIDRSRFPYEIELPENKDLKDVILFLTIRSNNPDISDTKKTMSYIHTISDGRPRPRFPNGLFTTGSGPGSKSLRLKPEHGQYEHPTDHARMANITSDFDDAVTNIIESMSEEQKDLITSCRDLTDKIATECENIRRNLEKYNEEAFYPGYCRFIDSSTVRLRIRKWRFKKL